MRDSLDYKDQEEYWDQKKVNNKKLLLAMNASIVEELGEDPLEGDLEA
jgi:hypothetical protein